MFCTKCGNRLDEEVSFCPACGASQNSVQIAQNLAGEDSSTGFTDGSHLGYDW